MKIPAYYSRFAKRAWRGAWFWATLVSAVFAIAIRYLQDTRSSSVPAVNHWAWETPLLILVGLLVINVFRVPYLLHKEDRVAADAAASYSRTRIAELLAKLNQPPELEILFDETNGDYVYESSFEPMNFGSDVITRLWKVAVKARDSRTVEDVNLELVASEPRPVDSPFPLPLHPVHGTATGLNPDTLRLFDVIIMNENKDSLMEIYSNPPAPHIRFPRGRYVLKLRANGKDAIPAERSFVADVNEAGKLTFRRLEA